MPSGVASFEYHRAVSTTGSQRFARRAGAWSSVRRWVCCAVLLCTALWSLPAKAAGLRFELVEAQMPETLPAGRVIFVPLQLRNLSDEAWDPAKKDHVAYHLYTPGSDQALVYDGLRTELPGVVEAGESVWVNARLEVPAHEGPLVVEWGLVRESVRWYPRPSTGLSPLMQRPVGAAQATWRIESIEADALAIEGTRVEVRATLVNEGWMTWDAARGDAFGLHWYDASGRLLEYEGARVPPPHPVPPGGRVALRWESAILGGAGVRLVGVEPVRDGVQWYGAPADQDRRARIEVQSNPFAWAIVGDFKAPELSASDELTIPIRLENVGQAVWGLDDRLSYQWLDDTGRIVGEGPRTLLPHTVPTGEVVELQARVAAPREPGRYRLRWGMLREGLLWYGPPAAGEDLTVWRLEVANPRLAFELVEHGRPRLALTRDLRRLEVTIRNVGSAVWDPQRGDSLAYHWLDSKGEVAVFEGRRTQLPGLVLPGDELELETLIEYPADPGRYELVFEMVREQVRWYGSPTSAGTTRALRAVPVYNGALALTFLAGCLVVRVLRKRGVRRVESFLEWWWILWAAAAFGILSTSFADLSHLEFWKGGFGLNWSASGWLALPLCFTAGLYKRGLALAMMSFFGALTLADVIYMHFFGSIVPISSIGHANHLGEVFGSAQTRFSATQLWLFTPVVTGVLGWWLAPAPVPDRKGEGWRFSWKQRLAAVISCSLVAYPAVDRLVEAMQSSLGARVFSEQHNAQRFGIFNAHAFDVARSLRESAGRRTLDDEARARVEAFFDQHSEQALAARQAAPDSYGLAAGKNLLLIQVEALQTWVIGAELEGREITPYLNSLRREGLYFRTVVDQTAQGKTSDGEYLALNSQHPLPQGATSFLRADNHFWTLAHVLAERGYETSSAHPYRRGFWNRAVLHPRYGFASSVFKRELGEGQFVGWGLADGLFFERMLPRLEAAASPWFAFWITLSLHHPYDHFPENLAELPLGELEGTRLGNYLQGMNYFDRSLRAFMQQLDAAGLAKDTVVALYGDHDARFELDEHPQLLALAHAGVWTPSTFAVMEQVPFFVVLPDGALQGEVDTLGGQIDIAPTLLHLLGVERPRSFVGHPLLPEYTRNFAAYPDGSAYAPDRVFVRRGRDIARGGACFFFPSGKPRPRADCDEIAKRAREELGLSRAVADTDMQRELAGVARGAD